jgi:hypothetical protein
MGVKLGLSLEGKNSLRTFDNEVLRKRRAECTVVKREHQGNKPHRRQA